MQSTIQLFHHLYDNLPPLVPVETKQKMAQALNFLNQDELNMEELEDIMIEFGYEVWPWNRAYRDFYKLAEDEMAEHFLLPKLSFELQKKYQDFKNYGGTYRDLHSGNPAAFFPKTNGWLCAKLCWNQERRCGDM